jgi:16S rRNA (guanine527-N7)-methyltransferase
MKDRLEQAIGRPVPRETLERLSRYVELLSEESRRQNLISAATLNAVWDRHILDSAQLVRFVPKPGATWVDIGSGAGLPGIVIACVLEGPVTLVEPRGLRAGFLQSTVRELDLNAEVVQAKAERVTGTYDVITGRAVASLSKFLSMCDHLSTRKTQWVLPKGRSAQSELEEAKRSWQGVFHVEQSITDPNAQTVVVSGVRAKKR